MNFKATKTINDLGGKERTLVWDMNAVCELEAIENVNILAGTTFWKDMSVSKFRSLIYVMLYKEDPRPDLHEVGEMISDFGFDKIGEVVAEMFESSFGVGKEDDNEKKL